MSLANYVIYPAIFTPDEDEPELLNIEFPDVPGALTCGKGLKEAMFNASEALALMLYDEIEKPQPSSLSDIQQPSPGAQVLYVGVDLDQAAKDIITPTVMTNTTIPAWLNAEATKQGIDFSQTLTEALKEKLGI